jgi:hypothetical protein
VRWNHQAARHRTPLRPGGATLWKWIPSMSVLPTN